MRCLGEATQDAAAEPVSCAAHALAKPFGGEYDRWQVELEAVESPP